jgi:uncharacterized protein
VLLEFSAANFRSLRDEQTLDLRTTATRELLDVVRHPEGLDAEARGVTTVAAVFGANASGKTSLFVAADFMCRAVLRSTAGAVEGSGVIQDVVPFKFDPRSLAGPTRLRVVFLHGGVRREYGMVLQPGPGARGFVRVASEWLREWPRGRARDVFLRGEAAEAAGHGRPWWVSEEGFHGGRRLAGDLFEQTRDDVLFLSLASQRNHPQAKLVVSWFYERFRTAFRQSTRQTEESTLMDPHFAGYLSRLMCAADTGIQRVEIRRDDEVASNVQALRARIEQAAPEVRVEVETASFTTNTVHRSESGEEVLLSLAEESHGTQRLFRMAGPIYAALRDGSCLWIDELDTGMHHWLLRAIVKMFQNRSTNPNGAQLLFTTHDAALMDSTLFRRDQIWIVEKDAAQGSQLYSLVDFEDKPRKSQPLFKAFLSGRFGGVPQLDETTIMQWPRGEP